MNPCRTLNRTKQGPKEAKLCYKMQHPGQLQEIIIAVTDKGDALLESWILPAGRQASGKEDKSSAVRERLAPTWGGEKKKKAP